MTGDHASFDVTYSNLQHTSYNGKKISSLTEHFDIVPNVTSNSKATNAYSNKDAASQGDNGMDVFSIDISHDPTKGFDQWGVKTTLTGQYLYEDGTPVNFQDGTAYLSVGSLNNYTNLLGPKAGKTSYWGYSIETTKVNSGGEAVGLIGSSVTAHSDGALYSDLPNSIANDPNNATASDYPKDYNNVLPDVQRNSNVPTYDGHYGDWDFNGSEKQYIGAGLIKLNGSKFNLTILEQDKGIPDGGQFRNWMWWNATSVIPKTPETILHYHYDKAKRQTLSYFLSFKICLFALKN